MTFNKNLSALALLSFGKTRKQLTFVLRVATVYDVDQTHITVVIRVFKSKHLFALEMWDIVTASKCICLPSAGQHYHY